MIRRFLVSMVVGGLSPFLPDCFSVPISGVSGPASGAVTAVVGLVADHPLPTTKRACEGCGYSQTAGAFCANCTVSIIWGAGNAPGTCKQVTPCGATNTQCKFGAYTVKVTAVSPGCTISFWANGGYEASFDLESGSASRTYNDESDNNTDCGAAHNRVKCGTVEAGVQCVACSG